MDEHTLRSLLASNERGNLDFKREWYKLEDLSQERAKREKGELIKDVLSLANGNTIVAGETAYPIIGADNEASPDGTRALFDVDTSKIDSARILKIVNHVCAPPLEELFCDMLILEGMRILVITIPPSPHLHETTSKLDVHNRSYDQYTVFVRHGEDVGTASAKEREQILKLKQIASDEMRNPHPMQFGMAAGALVGGILGSTLAGERLFAQKGYWPISGMASAGLGAFFGGALGYFYRSYYDMRPDWFRITPAQRVVTGVVSLAGGLGAYSLLKILGNSLKKHVADSSTRMNE